MIKFRAWDNEDEIYTNNEYYFELSPDGKELELVPTNGLIIEQYTGLKDMHGKDIYEGDIIKYFGANKKIKAKNEFGIIAYKADRYGAGFNSIIQNKEHGYGGINIEQDIVVGNVHENPELLEVKK
ncbi:hypothetical protein AYO51_15895 [Lactiplantibacillus plantarum]|uniref:YopX family protein n=1 Tax=Lactiplantibacillus plantarum TaxID=1590 RepID=UPI000787AAAE|nr:YopX family protein [Lactiplantibacillus plantarum]KYK53597.1 hypothetical protein AYO51_15895 [Lactiplantibacillus plantarum]KYM70888.1 hypothetical protein AZJ01_17580 [Lactiplantibacillus plantarum]